MGQTIVGLNDPKAVKRWATNLAVDVAKTSYFAKNMTSSGVDISTPVHQLTDLESEAGDRITFDLSLQLTGEGTEGDDILEGNEMDLQFATDEIYIDQLRFAVNTGGKMTRKRTLHNLRAIGKARLADLWSRVMDELHFMYASGARGVNVGFNFRQNYKGFAGNPFEAPDDEHHLFGGDAISKFDLTESDKMDLNVIDKAVAQAEMMGGDSTQIPALQPIMIDGAQHFVLIMNPWQKYDLRTAVGDGKWLDIQKAAAASDGKGNPIFTGNCGKYNDVVLHSHKNVILFNDFGVQHDVMAARALFMGSQALEIAWGGAGDGTRYSWHEEAFDHGNQVAVSSGAIFGIKKTRFNDRDFGVISIDTAAKDPRIPRP